MLPTVTRRDIVCLLIGWAFVMAAFVSGMVTQRNLSRPKSDALAVAALDALAATDSAKYERGRLDGYRMCLSDRR